jgi:hypothetical protein
MPQIWAALPRVNGQNMAMNKYILPILGCGLLVAATAVHYATKLPVAKAALDLDPSASVERNCASLAKGTSAWLARLPGIQDGSTFSMFLMGLDSVNAQATLALERAVPVPSDVIIGANAQEYQAAMDNLTHDIERNCEASAIEGEQAPTASLSAALTEDLTAQRSAALAAELSQQPNIALAAIVHALASRVLLHASTEDTSVQVAATAQFFGRVEGSKAMARMEAVREDWSRQIPGTPEELWQWCLEQTQGALLKLLAVCGAHTIDAVQEKQDRPDCARLQHADRLAAAVGLDLKEWFTPDEKSYFGRINKPELLKTLQEAKGQTPSPSWEKLKKSELAA